jgi:hypothetical protein
MSNWYGLVFFDHRAIPEWARRQILNALQERLDDLSAISRATMTHHHCAKPGWRLSFVGVTAPVQSPTKV